MHHIIPILMTIPILMAAPEQSVVQPTVTISITATGDCTLGNDTKMESPTCFNSTYRQNGPDYFFDNVRDIFERDDLTIINLEGAMTTEGSKIPNKDWHFRSDPSYLEILTGSSVEAVSFANNHCRDYGEVGYLDTMKHLEEAGILYSSEELTCVTDINGIPVGMISIQAAYRTGDTVKDKEYYDTQFLMDLTDQCIADVKKKGAKLILVNFHWGVETKYTPSTQQKELGHHAIDAGANLVIGHHPHRIQPVEYYNGCYILYSLGNFCFGGNSNPKDKDTFIWRQYFTFLDGHLQQESPAILVPCSISSTSARNDFKPTLAAGPEATRIWKKINDLSAPYGVYFADVSGLATHH